MPSAPVSVVIPTLDAARRIGPTLGVIAEGVIEGVVSELIIADGGSTDEIHEIADAIGAEFVPAPPGRGTQLAAGARAARGSWLLFIHADTRLSPDWIDAVKRHIETHSHKAGFFRHRFLADGFAPAFVSVWANFRSTALALPYGDQGLLIPAALYRETGGFPEIPLMEDVALARRLGRRRLRRLGAEALTGAERYERDGWLRRGARNLAILLAWRLGASPGWLAERYAGSARPTPPQAPLERPDES